MFPNSRLSYPFKNAEGIRERELPLVVGILADLGTGDEPRLSERRFRDIDRYSFDNVVSMVTPRIVLHHELRLEKEIEIRFRCMEDFDYSEEIHGQLEAAGRSLQDMQRTVKFTRLEATWRGIQYLVSNTSYSEAVRFRLLDVSYQMLSRDLQKAPSYDQSYLFKFLHDNVYGSRDGEPFSLLVADFAFGHRGFVTGHSEESIQALDQLARIAAAIHAPIVASAHPHIVGVEYFDILDTIPWREIGKQLDAGTPPSFQAFQAAEHSRYACLVLPQVLWRRDRLIWGSVAFVAAARMVDSFVRTGWCSEITGISGGECTDLLLNLPDATKQEMKLFANGAALDDKQDAVLSAHGFACLQCNVMTHRAWFWNMPTCHYEGLAARQANHGQRISRDQMPYMLVVSRFAQYLRRIAYSTYPNELSREELELALNAWLQRYVSKAPDASPQPQGEPRALLEARVELTGHPDPRCGSVPVTGVAFLRPHPLLAACDGLPIPVALGACGSLRAAGVDQPAGVPAVASSTCHGAART